MSNIIPRLDWFSFLSLLSVIRSVTIEHLARCWYWISWLDLIIYILWFGLISSILWFGLIGFNLWSELISLISLFDLIILTWLFFSSPPCERWWKTIPITFQRILLVSPRPDMKYMRTVYPNIFGSGHYVNPFWSQLLQSFLLLTNSCVEVVIIYICYTVNVWYWGNGRKGVLLIFWK